MKALIVRHHADGRLEVEGGVDSAVLRNGEPLFIEEPAEEWLSEVAPAVRIGRLGMNISERNAPAYIDAMTAVHLLTPVDKAFMPPFFCDRAISPGSWHTPAQLEGDIVLAAHTVALPPNPPESRAFETSFSLADAGAIVSLISQHLTFKTGDIIILRDRGLTLGQPRIDTSLQAGLNGEAVLDIRLK